MYVWTRHKRQFKSMDTIFYFVVISRYKFQFIELKTRNYGG